jgi:hypothetical protein
VPGCDVDLLVGKLAELRNLALSMPPSWGGAGISHPVLLHPGGDEYAHILPGKGLYLNRDLKSLGVTRRIPGIYERSPIRRLAEAFARAREGLNVLHEDEKGAIVNYDGIINARAGGNAEDRAIVRLSVTTVANQWSSLWQSGGLPAAGTYSGTPGSAPNGTTTGALSNVLSDPSGGNSKYLLSFGFTSASAINMLLLTDLLSQVGSLSAASSTSQTVSSTALTRYTTGAGVMAILDVTTAIGTTASNVNLNSYTNQAGTAAQSSVAQAMTTSAIVQRLQPTATGPFMQLASGDFGVRAVSTLKLSAAMSAGVFALNLYYPLLWIPGIVANVYIERDSTIQLDGLAQLVVGSDSHIGALNAYVQTNSTSSGILVANMRTCAG